MTHTWLNFQSKTSCLSVGGWYSPTFTYGSAVVKIPPYNGSWVVSAGLPKATEARPATETRLDFVVDQYSSLIRGHNPRHTPPSVILVMHFIYFTASAAILNESDAYGADNPWNFRNIIKINCGNKKSGFPSSIFFEAVHKQSSQRTPAKCHLGEAVQDTEENQAGFC